MSFFDPVTFRPLQAPKSKGTLDLCTSPGKQAEKASHEGERSKRETHFSFRAMLDRQKGASCECPNPFLRWLE